MDGRLRWRLVVLAAAGLFAMELGIGLFYGIGEEAIRVTLRATARTSTALFLLAYTASAAYRLWPSPITAWPLHNRRYLGISVAISQTLHLIAIWLLIPMMRPDEGSLLASIVGGGSYVAMYAMAATSNDRAVRWLGIGQWRKLHGFGLHYLWFVFTFTFIGSATAGSSLSGIASALLLVALGVRIAARVRRRRTDSMPT